MIGRQPLPDIRRQQEPPLATALNEVLPHTGKRLKRHGRSPLRDSLDEKQAWSVASAWAHAGVGVAEGFFRARAAVADDEGALADLPERDPAIERRQEFGFGAGESEGVAGPVELVGGLAVDDPGFGVGEEAFGQGAFA